jgi:hypothetical protein
MVIGPIFENGGLLPYLYAANQPDLDKLQRQHNFNVKDYNKFVNLFNIKAKILAHSQVSFVTKGNSVDIHATVKKHFHELVDTFFIEETDSSLLREYHKYTKIIFSMQEHIFGACNDRMAHASAAHLVMSLDEDKHALLPCLKYRGPAHNGTKMRSYLACSGGQFATVDRRVDADAGGEVVQQLIVKVIDPAQRRIFRNPGIFKSIIPPEEVDDCGSSFDGSTVTASSANVPLSMRNTPSLYCRDFGMATQMATQLVFPGKVGGNTEVVLPTVYEEDKTDTPFSSYQDVDLGEPHLSPLSPLSLLSQFSQTDDIHSSQPSHSPAPAPPPSSMGKRSKEGGSTALQQKRTVKRRHTNNRKTQQYSNKKKHSSNKKKSVITKKTKVSKSKRNNKTKTKRRRNH